MSNAFPERIQKKFWVIDTEGVKVTEEVCLSTQNPGVWFCPKYGFTGTEGGSFFEYRQAAVRAVQEVMLRRLSLAEANYQKALKL